MCDFLRVFYFIVSLLNVNFSLPNWFSSVNSNIFPPPSTVRTVVYSNHLARTLFIKIRKNYHLTLVIRKNDFIFEVIIFEKSYNYSILA